MPLVLFLQKMLLSTIGCWIVAHCYEMEACISWRFKFLNCENSFELFKNLMKNTIYINIIYQTVYLKNETMQLKCYCICMGIYHFELLFFCKTIQYNYSYIFLITCKAQSIKKRFLKYWIFYCVNYIINVNSWQTLWWSDILAI